MKKMSLLLITMLILSLSACNPFAPYNEGGFDTSNYVEFEKPIGGFRMYYTDLSDADEETCRKEPYYELFTINMIEYVTYDLNYDNGCTGSIKVYDGEVYLHLNSMLYLKLLDESTVLNYEYGISIVERTIYVDRDDVTKVEIYTNDVLEVELLEGNNDFKTLSQMIHYTSFREGAPPMSTYLYTIKFYENEEVFTFDVYEDYMINTDDSKIYSNTDGYDDSWPYRVRIGVEHNQ